MNCRSADRLIHLYREGELTRREQSGLRRHLDRCAACVEKATAVAGDLEEVRTRLGTPLDVPDPDGLTAAIMTGVGAVDRISRRSRRLPARPLPSPYRWVQPALGTAILALAFMLLLQEAAILNRVMRLEEQIARREAPVAASQLPGLTGDMVRGIDWLEGMALRGGRGFPGPGDSEEWIVIRRRELTDMLNGLVVEEADRASIERLLRDSIPGLKGIVLEDGLSRAELQALLEHRTEIVNALRQL